MIEFKVNGTSVEIASQAIFNRNRKERADNGSIRIVSTRSSRYEPYTRCSIGDEQYLIESDNPMKLKGSLWEHDLTLIENTAILTTVYPVDRSFKRVPALNLRQILGIYKRELAYYHDFFIDYDANDDVYDTEIVDKEYASKDMAAIIYDLFRSINAIPRLTWSNNEWQLTYEKYTDKGNLITLKVESRQSQVNDIDYATGIIGKTRNAVGNAIYWPSKNKYAKPRIKATIYRTSDLQYELDSDITAIYEVNVKVPAYIGIDTFNDGNFDYTTVDTVVNIITGVYEEEVYETLPLSSSNNPQAASYGELNQNEPFKQVGDEYVPYKQNTIKYSLNNNVIDGLFWTRDGILFNDNINALINLITYYITDTVWAEQGPGGTGLIPADTRYTISLDPDLDVEDIEMQVKYRPKRDIDFITEKNDTTSLNKAYILNNQKDTMVDISKFLDNANATVERIGNERIIISQTFADYATAFKLGDYYSDWIITDIQYTLDKTLCKVVAEFNENFTNIDRETSVTREPNPYVITGRGLQSNFIYKEYIVFYEGTTEYIDNSMLNSAGKSIAMNIFDYNATFDKPLNSVLMRGIAEEFDNAYHLPLLANGGSNAMLFHMAIRDPRIVGNALIKSGTYWYKEPVWYIYKDTLGLPSVRLQLAYDYVEKTDTSTYKYYPIVDLNPDDEIMEYKSFPVDKDPNDLLAFTFEFISFSESNKIIIGEGFSKYNNLVFNDVSDIELQVYSSTEKFTRFDKEPKGTLITASITLIGDTLIILDELGEAIPYWCIAYNNEIILAGNHNISVIKYTFTRDRDYYYVIEFVSEPELGLIFSFETAAVRQVSYVVETDIDMTLGETNEQAFQRNYTLIDSFVVDMNLSTQGLPIEFINLITQTHLLMSMGVNSQLSTQKYFTIITEPQTMKMSLQSQTVQNEYIQVTTSTSMTIDINFATIGNKSSKSWEYVSSQATEPTVPSYIDGGTDVNVTSTNEPEESPGNYDLGDKVYYNDGQLPITYYIYEVINTLN